MHTSEVIIEEIFFSDKEMLSQAAGLVSEYSWGRDYPVSPLTEIERAEYCIGAFVNGQLIGFSSVGFAYSPDGADDDQVWFGHGVVVPAFRKQGIFRKMYEKQMAYAKGKFSCVFACSSNPVVQQFLAANGWEEVRETNDEKGDSLIVFRYSFSR